MRRYECISRAAGAWAAFVVATAVAAVVGGYGRGTWGLSGVAAKVGPALATLVVVVVVLLMLHRRALAESVPLRRPRRALVGVAVVATSAAATFGVDHLLGGTTIRSVDWPRFLVFVVVTLCVAGAQEALPEELALRGSAYGSLRRALPAWGAAVATTGGFVVAPGAGIALGAALGRLLGVRVDGPSFAPGGQDPVAYAVLLACFGAMLVLGRIATDSVWCSIAAHLMFLLVNRALVAGDGFDSGVRVAAPPGAELLVLVYLVIAAAWFAVIARKNRWRGGGRVRQPGRGSQTAQAEEG